MSTSAEQVRERTVSEVARSHLLCPKWFCLSALTFGLVLLLGGGKGPEPGPVVFNRLGAWPGFGRGPAADIAVVGDKAFVPSEQGGLLILDVADAVNPKRVTSYPLAGQTRLVRVSGSRAYVAATVPRRGGGCDTERWRGRLAILDISNPTSPKILGQYTTSREIRCFSIDADKAYLCDSTDGLHVVDVSDPAFPKALSVGQPVGWAYADCIWASGGRLYAASYGRVCVFDVSQPTRPVLVSEYSSGLDAQGAGICGVGGFVFLAQTRLGYGSEVDRGYLSVLEGTASGGLELRGTLELTGIAALDLKVQGTRAYIAAGPAGVALVDISDPLRMRLQGTCDTPGLAAHLALAGSRIFVADYHGGVQVLDAPGTGLPSIVSACDTGLTVRKLRVSSGKAYLLSSDTHPKWLKGFEARSRLEIVDVKNPSQPALLGSYDLPRLIVSMDVAGDMVYLGYNRMDRFLEEGEQRMQVLDVSVPGHPVCLSDMHVGDYAGNLAVRISGERAYVSSAGEHGFQVFDVRNPVSPMCLGYTNVGTSCEEVRLAGNVAYLGQDWALEVFDISDPAAPQPVNSVGFEYSSGDDCDT